MKILLPIIFSTLLLACSNEPNECKSSFEKSEFTYTGEILPAFELYSEIKIVKSKQVNYVKLLVWYYAVTEEYYKNKMNLLGEPIDTFMVNILVQPYGSHKKEWQLVPRLIFINDSCTLNSNDLCDYFNVLDSLDIRNQSNRTENAVIDGITIKNHFEIDSVSIERLTHSHDKLFLDYIMVTASLNLIKSKLKGTKSQKFLSTLEEYL